MHFLGINFLFIGADSLGTPNDRAPINAPLEATCCLATTPITTLLLKCPPDATCHTATEEV